MRPARKGSRGDLECPCCGGLLEVEAGDIEQDPNGGWPDVTAGECPRCKAGIRVWMHDVMAFSAAPAPVPAPARTRTRASDDRSRGEAR